MRLIEEKAKDPANWDRDGRLCVAPNIYIRMCLTEQERQMLYGEADGSA
jgi:hypothetical protein